MLPRLLRTSVKVPTKRNIFRKSQTLRVSRWYADAQPAPNELKITIATPNAVILDNVVVDSVVLPGIEGQFEVVPRLVPLITELQPGVITVIQKGSRSRYFASGGFVFVHSDSTCNVNPAECVKFEDLDADAAREALTQAQQKFGHAKNSQEKAAAQIALDTADAVIKALLAK